MHRRDAANLGVESLDSLPHAWLRRGDEVLVRTVWRAAQDGSLELVISLHQGHALWNGGKSDLASLVRDLRTQLQERTSEVTSATDLVRGPIEDKDHHSSVRKFSVNFVIPFNCSAVGFSNEGLPGGEEGLVFVKRS